MLKRTPLYESHKALGGRMVEFGGWDMPVQYSSIMEEHAAVRTAAGVFDISHMGRFLIIGPDTRPFLQYTLTCDIERLAEGHSQYGLLCHSHGGIVDDVFIYNIPGAAYMLVVNAANTQKDRDFLLANASGFNVKIADYTEQWAMLAFQGPEAESLLVGSNDVKFPDIANLAFHGIIKGRLFGIDESLISRTGYTGEDGFELFFDASRARRVWDGLLALSEPGVVKPCGLGARDSLRFEPCLALYGHEISDTTNPYEARLGWVVDLNKDSFIGRETLQRIKDEGLTRKLVGFEMVGRGIPRHGYPLHDVDGNHIGSVTSGMHAPTLGKPLGLGYVPTSLSKAGQEFDVIIRNKPVRARVVNIPFYQPRYKK